MRWSSHVRRAIFIAAAALFACSKQERAESFVLRITVPGRLGPVNPSTPETYATLAQDLVFQAILFPDASGRARSAVAQKFERLGSDRCRISLDRKVRFSDGSPVTFEDVARGAALQQIRARRDGDGVLLASPGRFVEPLLFFTLLFRDAGGRVLGTGPFRTVEESPERIALERVRRVPGHIERVEILSSPSQREALARALRGEANGVHGLDERQTEFLEGVPALRVVRSAAPQARAVIFNDARIGRADRRKIRAALQWGEIARYGCGGAATTARLPNEPLPPGRKLSLLAIRETAEVHAALAVRRALGARGGEVRAVEFAELSQLERGRQHDAYFEHILAWPTSVLALAWSTGGLFNWAGFSSPAVDAAFARGDLDAAAAAIEREAPAVVLCRRERIGAFDSRIRNATLGWWGVLDTLPEWEVGP